MLIRATLSDPRRHLWTHLGEGLVRSRCGAIVPFVELVRDEVGRQWCPECSAALRRFEREAVAWERVRVSEARPTAEALALPEWRTRLEDEEP